MFKILIFSSLIVICFSNCPFNSALWDKSCYFFPDYEFDFMNAEQFCQDFNGNLASIHDSFLNDFLQQTAKQQITNSSMFWIGLERFAGRNSWLDGSDLDYTNWYPGEPNPADQYDSGYFDIVSATWKTTNSSTRLSFVCKIDPVV